MGYYILVSDDTNDHVAAGNAIISVAETVYRPNMASAWVPFVVDTKQWIFDRGYRYFNMDGKMSAETKDKPAGFTPNDVELVVVHDSEKRMHVRVPWYGAIDEVNPKEVRTHDDYPGGFPDLLAKYFMRSCR